jgi:hypothetical protein
MQKKSLRTTRLRLISHDMLSLLGKTGCTTRDSLGRSIRAHRTCLPTNITLLLFRKLISINNNTGTFHNKARRRRKAMTIVNTITKHSKCTHHKLLLTPTLKQDIRTVATRTLSPAVKANTTNHPLQILTRILSHTSPRHLLASNELRPTSRAVIASTINHPQPIHTRILSHTSLRHLPASNEPRPTTTLPHPQTLFNGRRPFPICHRRNGLLQRGSKDSEDTQGISVQTTYIRM